MDQEKYNLNWHSYYDHLREMLLEMKLSEEFTDVTLICEDKKQLKAHKIVLSACSTVFKSIISNLPQSNSVIYLRGVLHQEMESILEYMYLGVATLHQDRMNEFLNVAKSLEIKEISKYVEFDSKENIATYYEDQDNENINKTKSTKDEHIEDTIDQEPIPTVKATFNSNRMSSNVSKSTQCPDCDKVFAQSHHMRRHYDNVHKGVMFLCNQCDKIVSSEANLHKHIKTVHEGIKYHCNQCDKHYTQASSLNVHVRSVHEGVKFQCNHCGKLFRHRKKLQAHIKSFHLKRKDKKEIEMEEVTSVGDDRDTETKMEKDTHVNDDNDELKDAIDCMSRNLLRVKNEIKSKNLNEAKELLEQFRGAANIMLKDEILASCQREVLNDFNIKCDKIRDQRFTGNCKPYTGFIDKMELFLTEMEKIQNKRNISNVKNKTKSLKSCGKLS